MHRIQLLPLLLLLLLATLSAAPSFASEEDAGGMGPAFSEGDVLGYDDVDKLRPYLPEEFWVNRDFFFFEGMQLEIGPSHHDYAPSKQMKDATDAYHHLARIGPDNSLEGYVAGRAFPTETIDCATDPQAGTKIMWSFRSFGGNGRASFYYSYWDRGEELPLYYEGTGGGIQLAHRIEPSYLEANGGDIFRNEKRKSASGVEVVAPFDARGIMLLTYRYKAADKARSEAKNDDTWVYVPTLRRVRRISTAQRTDSISGTDFTMDDLNSFNGVVPQYEWECLGELDIIAPGNTRMAGYPYNEDQSFGPFGLSFADDRWEMRKVWKVRMTPKNGDHPYSYKDIFIDQQTFVPHYSFAYDRKDELWKIIWHAKRWSQDESLTGVWFPGSTEIPEPNALVVVSDLIVNVQTGTGNRIEFWDAHSIPDMSKGKIRRFIDVGRLTKGR